MPMGVHLQNVKKMDLVWIKVYLYARMNIVNKVCVCGLDLFLLKNCNKYEKFQASFFYYEKIISQDTYVIGLV